MARYWKTREWRRGACETRRSIAWRGQYIVQTHSTAASILVPFSTACEKDMMPSIEASKDAGVLRCCICERKDIQVT